MKAAEILELAAELIAIPSISGEEQEVVAWLSRMLKSKGWSVEGLPLGDGRENIFVSFGTPRIIFTTHLDVVPGPEKLFTPRREGNSLYGRGACDAKGIAASMIATCEQLLKRGYLHFGLLFVVGEEWDGAGAKAAARQLAGRGIRYIVNGEPTDAKLASGHKGNVSIDAVFLGKAAHSGYPQCGVDANAKLIRAAADVLAADFGSDAVFGKSCAHCGVLHGGVAGNVISPRATLTCSVRTVTSNAQALELLKLICKEADSIDITYDCPPVRLRTVADMEAAPVNFATDIPNFAPLGAEALLFGPGSILVAHTDQEFISIEEVEAALEGYERIFLALHKELLERK